MRKRRISNSETKDKNGAARHSAAPFCVPPVLPAVFAAFAVFCARYGFLRAFCPPRSCCAESGGAMPVAVLVLSLLALAAVIVGFALGSARRAPEKPQDDTPDNAD